MNFEVLTLGEKFKTIRKKYGFTQEDVACNDVTREFVSQVERNESNLPRKTAIKLLKNIKEKLSKDDIKFDIELNLKYLFDEDTNIQKQRILEQCDLAIKEFNMSNYDENKFKFFVEKTDDFFVKNCVSYEYEKIDNLLIKNGISYKQKINIYRDIAYIFLKNYDYSNAEIYFLKATSESTEVKNYTDVLKFIIDRIRVYHKEKNSRQQLVLVTYAFKYYKEHDIHDKGLLKTIYFYAATVYSILGEFKKCIKYLELLQRPPFKLEEKELLDIKNLYGGNFFRNKEYNKAEKINSEILDIAIRNSSKDIYYKDIVSRTYINLAEIYVRQGNIQKAREYLAKIDNLKHEYNYVSPLDVNYSLLELNIECNNSLSIVEKNFKNFIDICTIAKDNKLKSSAYKLVVNYYIKANEDKLLTNFILNIRKELKNKKINMDKKIYSTLIATLHYFKDRDSMLFEEIFTILVTLNE